MSRRRGSASSSTVRLPAAVELLRMDRLRDVSDLPFDPATMRGNMSAQVTLGMPLQGRSAAGIDHLRHRRRCDQFFRRSHDHGAESRGGAAARRRQQRRASSSRATSRSAARRPTWNTARRAAIPTPKSACRACSTRRRATISASIRRRSHRRRYSDPALRPRRHGAERDGRFAVEADLTPAQIDGLLPGWVKPSGKPARATFTLTTKPQSVRIDDLVDRRRRRRRQGHRSTSTARASCNRRTSRLTVSPTATAPT